MFRSTLQTMLLRMSQSVTGLIGHLTYTWLLRTSPSDQYVKIEAVVDNLRSFHFFYISLSTTARRYFSGSYLADIQQIDASRCM